MLEIVLLCYHKIDASGSQNGITYLLFLLHCVKQYGEKRPSIRRLRQLRWQIRRETGYVYQIRVEIHLQVMVLLIFPDISYDQDYHKKCQANIHAIL